jgi:trimeric autotransporter adhesin
MNPLIQLKTITSPLLITLTLLCFGLFPKAQAVVPPPDGGYPNFNTAEGQNALFSLTTGAANTAVGWLSLRNNTTGSFNTALGAGTLFANTADENTATGAGALLSNIGGSSNTATGAFALFNNVGLGAPSKPTGIFFGSFNTANGDRALFSNTNGNSNTATGAGALTENTTGSANTAVGISALSQNTTADQNTAIGAVALFDNSTGTQNTAVGFSALHDNSTGDNNIALGSSAGINVATASNVIAIGSAGADVSNSCFIGQIYSNVQPVVGTDPDVVTVNSIGRLGRANVSSRRYKHDIQPMHTASEAIYALKPVSFRYHKQHDQTQTIAFGLIAEEVAEVNPDLVGRNPEGEPESVRYEQINAMLLNEFLKEHDKVEEQGATIAQLKQDFQSRLSAQQKQIEALTAGLQRVSAQLELNKLAPQTVKNDQ